MVYHIVSAVSRNCDEADSRDLESVTYCQICYSMNRFTLHCRDMKWYNAFIRVWTQKNGTRLRSEGDHQRKNSFTRQLSPSTPSKKLGTSGKPNKRSNYARNTWYVQKGKDKVARLIYEAPNPRARQFCTSQRVWAWLQSRAVKKGSFDGPGVIACRFHSHPTAPTARIPGENWSHKNHDGEWSRKNNWKFLFKERSIVSRQYRTLPAKQFRTPSKSRQWTIPIITDTFGYLQDLLTEMKNYNASV